MRRNHLPLSTEIRCRFAPIFAVEKNDAAIPHRLIVTYRMVPGAPNFIAEFANWNATVHPSQAEFTFQPPADAKKIELGQAFRAAEEQE